jgi:asparagine synthase (glutamine-hydrolysing)
MIWGLFVGQDKDRASWEAAARVHAVWLDLEADTRCRCLPDGRSAILTTLRPRSARPVLAEDADPVSPPPARDGSWEVTALDPEPDGVTLTVDVARGELFGKVPVAACEPLYYSIGSRGVLAGNDLRWMGLWAGRDLDDRGIYAQHQFGAVPAPLTLFRAVRRVPNGHTLRLDSLTGDARIVRQFPGEDDASGARPEALSARTLGELESEYWERLQGRLASVPAGALLLFSGGVDSALLAALFRDLARPDVRLVNLSFGPEDAEARFALQMAERLNVRVEQIVCRAAVDLPALLGRLGRDYSFPFGDDSVIPANVLVHRTLAACAHVGHVVEGLGPDQLFGVRGSDPLLHRALRIPRFARRIAGDAYGWFDLAERTSRLGHALSRFRKSAQLDPLYAFSIAVNCLDGIAYHPSARAREEVRETLRVHFDTLAEGWPPETRFAALHQVHSAAGMIGMKFFDPLRRQGVHRHLPFMREDLVRLGLEMRSRKEFDLSVAKSFIKRRLAEAVPPEMVYRRKSGFAAPFREFVRDQSMQALIEDVVLSPANPLREMFDRRFVGRIAERTRHAEVSFHSYHFLWGLMFLSGWLRQLPALPDERELRSTEEVLISGVEADPALPARTRSKANKPETAGTGTSSR